MKKGNPILTFYVVFTVAALKKGYSNFNILLFSAAAAVKNANLIFTIYFPYRTCRKNEVTQISTFYFFILQLQ